MKKYGNKLKEAAVKHKDDPVDYGFQRLPGGINGGIAQLVKCGFQVVEAGKQNAGEYLFRAAGVVISPDSVLVNGTEVPCKGLQTSIIEMVCTTTAKNTGKVTSFEEHVAKIQNEMKKLGGPDFDVEDLEAAARTLEEATPYFRFSTSFGKASKEYPEPKVFENWHGSKGLEDYVPDETGSGVQDSSEPASEGAGDEPPEDKEVAGAEDGGDVDIAALVEAAEAKDSDAQAKLTELAKAAGADDDAIENAGNWQEVADLIGGSEEATEEEAAEEEAEPEKPWAPAKEEVYKFRVIDPKTKKPVLDPKTKKARKPIEVNVESVDKKKRTVTVKSLTDGKTLYKDVKWSQLLDSDSNEPMTTE